MYFAINIYAYIHSGCTSLKLRLCKSLLILLKLISFMHACTVIACYVYVHIVYIVYNTLTLRSQVSICT